MQKTWDSDWTPGSGEFPGGGNGSPLHFLAWGIPWAEEPGGLQSIGSHRDGHDWSDLAHSGRRSCFHLREKKEGKRIDPSLDIACRLALKLPGPKPISWRESFGWKTWDQVHCWSHRTPASHQPNTGKGLWCPTEGRARQKLVKFKKLLSSLLCAFPEQRGRIMLIIS